MKYLQLALLAALCLFATAPLQNVTAAEATGAASPAVPDPLTREAIDRLVSELDDKQVRTLLLKRLAEDAEARARELAAAKKQTRVAQAAAALRAYGALLADSVRKLPEIPGGLARAWSNFSDSRDGRPIGWLWFGLVAALGLGTLAGFGARAPAVHLNERANGLPSQDLGSGVMQVAMRALALALPLIAFVAVAGLVNLIMNAGAAADTNTLSRIIGVCTWTAATVAFTRLILTPTLPEWQHCPIASGAGRFLTWRAGVVALVFNGGFALAHWMAVHGVPYSATHIAHWVNAAVHLILIVTIWQARRGISGIAAGSALIAESGQSRFATWWPTVTIGLLVLSYVAIGILAAATTLGERLLTPMAITLVTVTCLPLFDHAIRGAVARLFAAAPDRPPALRAADEATQRGLVRVTRVLIAIVVVASLLKLLGVNIVAVAEQGMGAVTGGALVNILYILGFAYVIWEVVQIVIDRQIAVERVALGLDGDDEEESEMEGEGGGAGARLGTLLPLVRIAAQIAVLVMAALAVLGELGVNILPLLAGAGVVGLAIGFGAQTLVKDIISGVFFLIDDAFRKGEYIDIGTVKGTVERISLRSMQLRHHNGPLNTIPFGDIRHVTNFSRDWVVMKLSLRLTYDTDAEKVRKMIKKLGQELLSDPEWGPKFLQPLKSQGVIEMEDSAMIMRVKFMTKPGDQWGVRRIVFARIRELFEQNGIRFASREVTVRVNDAHGEPVTNERERAAAGAAALRIAEQQTPVGAGAAADKR